MMEFKEISKLIKKYSDLNLRVIAVNEDGPSEFAKVKQMVTLKKWPFIVVMDKGAAIAQKYHATAFPTSVLVGSDGKIYEYRRGFIPGDEVKIEESIRELINKKK